LLRDQPRDHHTRRPSTSNAVTVTPDDWLDDNRVSVEVPNGFGATGCSNSSLTGGTPSSAPLAISNTF